MSQASVRPRPTVDGAIPAEPAADHDGQRPTTWYEQTRAAFQLLLSANQARAEAEEQLHLAWTQASENAQWEIQRQRRLLASQRQERLDQIEKEYGEKFAALKKQYESEEAALSREREERLIELERRYREARQRGEEHYQDRLWRADSLWEAGEKAAKERWENWQRRATAAQQEAEKLGQEAEELLCRHGGSRDTLSWTAELPPADMTVDPSVRLEQSLSQAREHLAQGQQLPWLRWSWWWAGAVAAAASAIGVAPLAFVALSLVVACSVVLATAVIGAVLASGLWRGYARRRVEVWGRRMGLLLAEVQRAARLLADHANALYAQELLQQREKHAERRRRADQHYLPLLQRLHKQYESKRRRLLDELDQRQQLLQQHRLQATEQLEQQYQAARQQVENDYATQLAAAEANYAASLNQAEQVRDAGWQQLQQQWHQAVTAVAATFTALRQANEQFFPPWTDWHNGRATWPGRVPWGIRCGDYQVDLAALPGGPPVDPRLAVPPELTASVPAYVPFPMRAAVLVRVRDEGRNAGVAFLQNLMLRCLTGLPPGKVRFTLCDPLGLGENFAAFMHLADVDERLISGQIWTEPRDIEQQLTDLTEHITSVLQKYLRNQYSSIEEYNAVAGEVAEPYRILVVANFPCGFTSEAAQRLLRIAATGPSCGVCVFLSADTRQPMPRDFDLQQLEALSFTLAWKEGRLQVKDPLLALFPLAVEAPPASDQIVPLLQRYAEASRAAGRVEVPFDFIAPPAEQIWQADASEGLAVPIGRAGATRRQVFRLGQGTAQHALVAGKTGSGKSTLLHALITNLSLLYSPDEVELYLIDFKEGVEFQWYATLRLPHARVVAIESEREFGLSVLQRLDALLRERGECFRQAGVNELAAYRQWLQRQVAAGRRPPQACHCPRVLLIIDEFQQLFVEDDKIAQEAALLLDRLVRQGRAFGIHVLLGSQTLGGAYSLPRSTLDQMVVRIALQCSEADAQLILSKDNTAARLLSRPGEAIYNDQSGLVEGNEPFQVVWLPEPRRVEILQQLRQRAQERWPAPIVFAGHTHADLTSNATVQQLLAHPAPVKAPVAYVGEPVAIQPATAVVFRPQSGQHLLLIGQNEEAARGLFTATCLSLIPQLRTEQYDPALPPLILLDGTPDDAEHADFFAAVGRLFPAMVAVPLRTQLQSTLQALTNELHQRLDQPLSAEPAPRFLLIFGIQRFRELRKTEDDFGFGRRLSERPASPAEHLAALLREGASVGIHVLVWCDSLTNLQRTFERTQLRDFAWRVLFQMSPNDSSHLIDSPAAARLGRHRALLINEESERPEKFRPYGIPSWDWLQQAAEVWQRARQQQALPCPTA
ncbi:MAG: FtsK/SpoIIIE domain-containing protein [Thermogemmata sp.]|nr:FtsK/SpoIIIE domain-containing protein [Thermogemmata sp.]